MSATSLYKVFSLLFSLVMAGVAVPAFAGEFDCTPGTCRIEALQSSQWKPTTCHEPVKPKLSNVTNAAEFDAAADKFNQWTADSKVYMACVAKEATEDAANAQQVIAKAGKELQDAQVSALEAERKILEAKRPVNSTAGKPADANKSHAPGYSPGGY